MMLKRNPRTHVAPGALDAERLFEVVVTPEEIRITGSKTALERALICGDDEPGGPVPIFDREWCRLGDSNT